MNYSQINFLIDIVMPAVKPNTFKVIATVARLTWGWDRDHHNISLSDFKKITGIKNKGTLIKAISDALDTEYIRREEWANTFRYSMIEDSTKIVPDGTKTVLHYDNKRYENRTSTSTKIVLVDSTKIVPPSYIERKEKKEEKESISSTSVDYQKIRQQWIELFPQKSKPRADNKTLIGKTKTRMKSPHFQENWQDAMTRASRSTFLLNSSWFDLGWFLKNDDHYERCLNGKYDDRSANGQASGQTFDDLINSMDLSDIYGN